MNKINMINTGNISLIQTLNLQCDFEFLNFIRLLFLFIYLSENFLNIRNSAPVQNKVRSITNSTISEVLIFVNISFGKNSN